MFLALSNARSSRLLLSGLLACRSLTMSAPEPKRLQRALDSVLPGAAPRVQLIDDSPAPPRSLVVLDSSFNPPTVAHAHLLRACAERFAAERALLLLAKQNADKPVTGAGLVQRLQMMELLARDLPGAPPTLCGVTAHPIFVDKAAALGALCAPDAPVHLIVGYDTWVRVIDPKYYDEGGLHAALGRLFAAVHVVVASRDPAGASAMAPLSVAEQQQAVESALPAELTRGRLHFVEVPSPLDAVSSSAIRSAIARGDVGAAREMLPACLHAYVESEALFRESD